MKRRLLTMAVILVLLLGLSPRADAVDIKVYQLALNERFMDNELTPTNMPVNVNGTIYIPYTAFDRTITGVDLGVFYGQEKSDDTYRLTLYSRSGTYLTFDLLEQSCFLTKDGQKEAQSMRAIIRYEKVYVPASSVCRVFGLQYTYTATRTAGDLIRIRSSSSALSDAAFLDAAATYMQDRYDNYIQSLTPTPTPAPVPTVGPLPGGVTTAPPVVSQTPEDPEPQEPGEGPDVVLAFRCEDTAGLDTILNTLAARRLYALFLFPADELEENRAAVRSVLGDGHSVGLIAGDTENLLETLEEGNRVLRQTAWYRSHIALAEGGEEDTLTAQGWTLWSESVDGRPSRGTLPTRTILRQMESRSGRVYLTLDGSAATAQGLSNLLDGLSEAQCTILPATENQL